MITTLKAINKHDPYPDSWRKLLRHLGKTEADDEPLSIVTILDSNGLNDALWCLRAVEGRDREIRLYAVWCARQGQHLMRDPRSLTALDVAERYANGEASDAELSAAWAAAWAAEDAAWGAEGAAWAAAWAAKDAAGAAEGAAGAAGAAEGAAGAAAWAAAWAAEDAARAAEGAAKDAAWGAAWAAARKQQGDKLREICLEVENE
jgi:hypothetical protein